MVGSQSTSTTATVSIVLVATTTTSTSNYKIFNSITKITNFFYIKGSC